MLFPITQRFFDLQKATHSLTKAIIQCLRDEGEVRSLETRIVVDKLDEMCVQNAAEVAAVMQQLTGLAAQTESGSVNRQLLRYWAEGCRVSEPLYANFLSM